MRTLPKFILLHGTNPTCKGFASELTSRQKDVISMDILDPIIESLYPMFYNGDVLGIDLHDIYEQLKHIPFSNLIVRDWVDVQKHAMRTHVRPDILAQLLLKEHHDAAYEFMAPTCVVLNVDDAADGMAIASKHSDTVLLNLGPLTDRFVIPNMMTYWFSTINPKEQVDNFLRDIETDDARAATA